MKAKPQSDEYRAFENVLGKVLTVTKAELKERLKKEEPQQPARPLLSGPSKK